MPATPITETACRTLTGTEVHAAPHGFARTNCGCRVAGRLTVEQLFAAQARGALCARCWGPASQTEAPAVWQARFAG